MKMEATKLGGSCSISVGVLPGKDQFYSNLIHYVLLALNKE